MANKLPKSLFGATGLEASTGTQGKKGTANNIPIRFKTGGTVYEGKIVKQLGARRFKCRTDNDATTANAILSNAITPASNGDASLIGLYNGQAKPLRKLNLRTAIDFSGNRYKWTLSDDSTETLIILTSLIS